MTDLASLGPLNSGVLLLLGTLGAGLLARALWRLNRGQAIPAFALALVLALPLLFSMWAGNGQLELAFDDVAAHPDPRAKQTLLALAFLRAILTQAVAGFGVAVLAALLVGGALALTVRGERPRHDLGRGAVVLGGALVVSALAALSVGPSVLLAARSGLYLVMVVACGTALVGMHRRGPGVQLGLAVTIGLPLLVAAVDQATIAWYAGTQLEIIARAVPAEKAALMETTIAGIDQLRRFSGLQLGLAVGLALLAPAAAWRRERPQAARALTALAAVALFASIGIGWSSNWLEGFR